MAEALKDWLPQVIQSLDPWISVDIDKGRRWDGEIASQLEESGVGIICLTKENLQAPWLNFEAGALSKRKDDYTCTLLLDIKPTEVKPPLGLFQHTTCGKEDIYKMVLTIREAVGNCGERVPELSVLAKLYEKFWPDLEKSLSDATSLPLPEHTPSRTEKDLLEEILGMVRAQEKRQAYAKESEDAFSEMYPTKSGRRIHDLVEFQELWPFVLARLKKKIGPTAVAYFQDAQPVALDEREAVLEFKKEFHYEKACEASKRLPFEKVINECLFMPRKLRFRLCENPES